MEIWRLVTCGHGLHRSSKYNERNGVVLSVTLHSSLAYCFLYVFTLSAGAVAKYCDEYVCLCVCTRWAELRPTSG